MIIGTLFKVTEIEFECGKVKLDFIGRVQKGDVISPMTYDI